MNRLRVCGAASLLLGMTACGGTAPASFTGSVGGVAFQPVESVSAAGAVVLSDRSGFCDLATRNVAPKSSHYFVIAVGKSDGASTEAASAPGTYAVVDRNAAILPSRFAQVAFVTVDAVCKDPNGPAGISGTVVITKVEGDVFSGTFDLVLAGGDHVSGAFSPTGCPGLPKWGTGSMTCG